MFDKRSPARLANLWDDEKAAKLSEPADANLAPDPEATVTDPAVAEGGRTSPDEIEVPEKVS